MSQWVLLSIQVVASAVLVWAVLAVRAASKRYEDCVASVSEAARSLRWGQAVAPCRSRQAPSPIARERRERAVADTFDPFTITWDLPGRVSEELKEVQEQAAANLRKATELSSELADTERRLGIAVEDERDPADRATELLLEAGSVVRTTRVQDQARGLEPVSCRFDGSPKGICGLNVGDSVVIKRMDEGPRSGASDVDIHNSCTVSHANECFCHGVDAGREHLFDDKCGKRVHRDAGSGRDEARAVHDSSLVGGDGDPGGDSAPSPVDGSTDPTEEAQSSEAASAGEVAALRASAVETERRTFVVQVSGGDPEPGSAGRLELAAHLQRSWGLLQDMPVVWALAEALSALLVQVESPEEGGSGQASGGLRGLAFEEVGDGADLVIRLGDGGRHGDAGADEEGGVALLSGQVDPSSLILGSEADRREEVAQGGAVPVGEVVVPGVGDLQDGHDDSSSVGDGAMDGGPAPSPVDGSTDPTEEAPAGGLVEEAAGGDGAGRFSQCGPRREDVVGAREICVGAVLTPRPQLPRVRIEGLAEVPLILTTGEAVSLARLLELSAAEADASYEVMTDPDWRD